MQLDFNQLKKTTIFCSACETRLFNAPFSKTITYSPSKLAANPFWQNFVSIKRSMHDWLEPKTTVIIPIPNWEKNSKRQFFLLRASTEIDMLAFENGQIIVVERSETTLYVFPSSATRVKCRAHVCSTMHVCSTTHTLKKKGKSGADTTEVVDERSEETTSVPARALVSHLVSCIQWKKKGNVASVSTE